MGFGMEACQNPMLDLSLVGSPKCNTQKNIDVNTNQDRDWCMLIADGVDAPVDDKEKENLAGSPWRRTEVEVLVSFDSPPAQITVPLDCCPCSN